MTTENTLQSNIIKTRDDYSLVRFVEGDEGRFKVDADSDCSWAGKEKEFNMKDLRQRIEPWLTSLFQSEHLSLLIGSGLTHAVHKLAVGTVAIGMGTSNFSVFNAKITNVAKTSAKKANRKEGNFEDQLRVANELLGGLKILSSENKKTINLGVDIENKLNDFAKSILDSESGIAYAEESKRTEAFNILVNFLMSFASRTGTRDRLQIFTTNYDRIIEAGAEIAGLHLLDRFVGSLMPIFRSSRLDLDMHYNPPGIRGEPRYLEGVTRFTKLHGSIDWVQHGEEIRRIGLPLGAKSIDPFLKAPAFSGIKANNLMIYPNASKDRETSGYPYVELFRDFAAGVCRPNNALVTYGYSFGDEHINRSIKDMLTIPSTHLVIISYDDPLDRIIKTYDNIGRPSQITLLIGNHLGDFKTIVDNYLPKSAIDRATFRMSEILKSRFGTQQSETVSKELEEEK
ncbi:SIR2 family protein [bacterium]|nr:SIR2 family protein [bacterium]